jgi:trimethylamine:corrinoid methyltransferase-like protein
MSERAASARREGRRRRDAASSSLPQRPPGQVQLPFPPMRLISDDEVETIHRSALRLLEEIGMDVLNPEARDLYRSAGAIVEGERVRIGREIVDAALKTAPAEFTMYCRNQDRDVRMGGNWVAFWPVGGRPIVPTRTGAAAPAHLRTTTISSAWPSSSTASAGQGADLSMHSIIMPGCVIYTSIAECCAFPTNSPL